MTTFDSLLGAVYEIQGLADPNHGDGSLTERMAEIWEIACGVMDESGYRPPMPTLSDIKRRDAADAALADYDFGDEFVDQAGGWQHDGDEWTCVLAMSSDDSDRYTRGFIVRFEPGTARVLEAYPGDIH